MDRKNGRKRFESSQSMLNNSGLLMILSFPMSFCESLTVKLLLKMIVYGLGIVVYVLLARQIATVQKRILLTGLFGFIVTTLGIVSLYSDVNHVYLCFRAFVALNVVQIIFVSDSKIIVSVYLMYSRF